MTLSQLALTIGLLAGLGLLAGRFGLSAIPAYLLAGLLLGPHEPHVTSLIEPSEVTTFVAELGIIFLLFFLGLEFTMDRLLRSGRHIGLGGDRFRQHAAVGDRHVAAGGTRRPRYRGHPPARSEPAGDQRSDVRARAG